MKGLVAIWGAVFLLAATAASGQSVAFQAPGSSMLPAHFPAAGYEGGGYDMAAHKNEVKLNLLSLVMANLSLQYERSLVPHLSAALAVRVGPERGLPFSSLLEATVGDDTVSKRIISDTRLSNYAFTPEVRYYFGKDLMSGFYIGLFGRFGKFTLDMPYTAYDPGLADGKQEVLLKGGYAYSGGGLQIGAKFTLSNRVSLDWFFLGPMATFGTASLDALTDLSDVTAEGKENIKRELLATFGEVTVDDKGIYVKRDLPMPGVRTGLAIGFRF